MAATRLPNEDRVTFIAAVEQCGIVARIVVATVIAILIVVGDWRDVSPAILTTGHDATDDFPPS